MIVACIVQAGKHTAAMATRTQVAASEGLAAFQTHCASQTAKTTKTTNYIYI